MSKIGKMPIIVPDGLEITLSENHIKVKGSKGELELDLSPLVTVVYEEGKIMVKRTGDSPEQRSFHGLMRSLINNMVEGVSKGFQKRLEIIGVGYRAQVSGKKVTMNLGFSHPIDYVVPEGVTVEMDKDKKNVLVVSGIDRQAVGQVAAHLRRYRPPEPYKGKGVRYEDEYVHRKAGKTAAAKE